MPVRTFRPEDAQTLAKLFFAAVHEVAALHYSKEQIEAWAPAVPEVEAILARASDGRTMFVATDECDEPLAYGDLEADGHIDHLFCRPDVAGTGVTSALYDRLENIGRDLGLQLLYVEASEPARRFFERKGFTALMRREFPIRGVLIHNYYMEKRLGV